MVVYTPLPLSPSNRKTLISSALSARDGSYSPYSNFRVGACLLTDEGEFVSGANVECASYGGAICAERTAIVKGVSEGKRRFVALARRQRNGLAVWDLQAGLEGVLSARDASPPHPLLLRRRQDPDQDRDRGGGRRHGGYGRRDNHGGAPPALVRTGRLAETAAGCGRGEGVMRVRTAGGL
ncbi:hypothetical protein NBRC10512_005828 [Rhodotorula toruloides]|uniref:Cytidine deaminase n=1 Tax=Rhodotorula toruloides (strain NP11) TaxID=1130832 RepID=M7XFA7_RHOT1|nr:cytidine deaminase [Rhodotorula toruloides NP11]EMS18778.1 cytidine deaminase [Rhodotorula toruloides NP11]